MSLPSIPREPRRSSNSGIRTMSTLLLRCGLGLGLGVALALDAQAADPRAADHGAHAAPTVSAAASAAAEMSSGEVRRIDQERRRITLRHGEIRSLDMPPMTMVFVVKDLAWLDRFKVGDRVLFRAEKIDGVFTVTEMAPAP